MRFRLFACVMTVVSVGFTLYATAGFGQTSPAGAVSVVPSRITQRIDESDRVILRGNTSPMARGQFDRGLVEPSYAMDRMVLVLKRSPEQEAALAEFNERQLDENSPEFHHWLHADEFGKLYGPSDADMATVTGWLERQGFRIDNVSKGRVNIQFSGTAAQVQHAFHVEIHKYEVAGEAHTGNDRDPEIPEALAPVVEGVASLHNFFGHRLGWSGNYVHRDPATGKITKIEPQPQSDAVHPAQDPLLGSQLVASKTGLLPEIKPRPQLTYTNANSGATHEDLTAGDFAAVYNMTPLFNQGINGKGVTVAITATSDVTLSDVATYRSSFGLPATTVNVIQTNPATDPGITDPGENTEDLEMVSAAAPGATLDLVVSNYTSTTSGFELADEYIIDNEVAHIMTVSYGICELYMGTALNTSVNKVFQQGATEGISIFVASGDSGSATCERQETTAPAADVYGNEVSGYASTPYATAVGGTDFNWSYNTGVAVSTYWNATNSSTYATAKGYIPELPWNTTCASPSLLTVFVDQNGNPEFTNNEDLCNAAINDGTFGGLVTFSAGGGGYSRCTTNSTPANPPDGYTFDPTSCSGGYAKPSWQTGTGVPADGKRDVPDIAMFGSYGYGGLGLGADIDSSAILVCISNAAHNISCNYTDPAQIPFQENGGTSAASPFSAGVMALIVQKTGESQGLANPEFYKLAASQNTAACNSNTVAAGNACYFYDITTGSNAQVCVTGKTDCVTNTAGDQVGIMSGFKAGVGYDQATGLGTMNVANLVNAWPTTATTSATLSPSSLSFPSTTVGMTSTTTGTVTLKNTGTATITFSGTGISITGTNATSYSKTTTCGTTLAAGASCTITVSFAPTTAGTLTGTLSVVDNAGTQTASLTGTGAAASSPTLTVTPGSLTFASTAVGSDSATQAITIKNTGSSAITLSGVAFSGTGASSFVRTSTTCSNPLAAGASCNSYIEFQPTAAGAIAATLTVSSNAPAVSIAVTGTGTAAGPALTVMPGSLTFGSTVVGSVSATQAITLKNTGGTAITLSGVAFSGSGASSFVRTSTTCSNPLAVGASCNSYVEFQPTTTGAISATLTVNSSAPSVSIPVSGTGAAAGLTLTVTPGSLTFASTAVGTATATQAITIKNTGSSAITLSGVAISGTGASSFTRTSTTCSNPLAAGASCNSYVQFKPTTTGTITATLTVNSNAPAVSIPLSGTGAPAGLALTVTPSTLIFSSTTVGTASATQAITISNTGSGAVTLSGVTFSGSGASSFVRTSTTCSNPLAAGASCTSYIEFMPTVTGALSATLAVNSNAANSPQTVAVSGTGK